MGNTVDRRDRRDRRDRGDRGDRGDADGGRDREEIMSIDFDKLDHRTVRELQNYVRLQKNTIVHDKD